MILLSSVTAYCNNGTFADLYSTCHSISGDCAPQKDSIFEWPETSPDTDATLTCPEPYIGTSTRHCGANGQWEAYENTCKQHIQCPEEYYHAIQWPATDAGAARELLCPYGFPARTTRQCNEKGVWEDTDDVCLEPTLSCPQSIAYGVTWPETEGGQRVTAACPAGYKGSLSRFCTTQGVWENVVDSCLAMTCASKTESGYQWPETKINTEVSLPCTGDMVTGVVTRICDNNQNWGVIKSNCHYPCPADTYNNVQYPKTVANTTVQLPCKQGYSGFISRYCTLYGTWENPIENCEMLTCFADSGFPTVEGNQIVHLPCHPSFSFLGELTRECFNGMWKEIQGDCTAANGWFYTIIVLLCVIVIACLIFALFVCKRTHGDFAAMNKSVISKGQKVHKDMVMFDSTSEKLI